MRAKKILELFKELDIKVSVVRNELVLDAPDGTLDDRLISQIREEKQNIIALVEESNGAAACTTSVAKCSPKHHECKLSMSQQRMQFILRLESDQSLYNIPVAYKIVGPLNKDALKFAFFCLVAENSILRTTFICRDGNYVQSISEPEPLTISEHDIGLESDSEKILERLLRDEAHYCFDLEREWPLKVSIIRLGEDDHVLCLNVHHIAADGFSARNMLKTISDAYNDFANDRLKQRTLPSQYVDYIVWHEQWMDTERCSLAKRYWTGLLLDAPRVHGLPIDFPRPNLRNPAGKTFSGKLPLSCATSVAALAKIYQTTIFSVLQAAFAALLARYSGDSDIVFGSVASGRPPEFISAVGLFANSFPLRYSVDDQTSFEDLILCAKQQSLQLSAFQYFPFDLLVDELKVVRSPSFNPIMQVMLVMQEDISKSLSLEGSDVSQITLQHDIAKFDLALHVTVTKDGLRLDCEYSTCLFVEESIKQLLESFERLINACTSAPKQLVTQVNLVTDLPPSHNEVNLDRSDNIHCLFEFHAAQYPEAIALRIGEYQVSYGELNKKASKLANRLYVLTTGEPQKIGVCVERSEALVIAMLAIFKAGAIYVPLDPHHPKERSEWIVADAQIKLLLVNNNADLNASIVGVDSILSIETILNEDVSVANLPTVQRDAGAYVLYTSGSTGRPKGVLVSHKNISNSIQTNAELMEIGARDIVATLGSQAFGISFLEMLLPLSFGGSIEVVSKAAVLNIHSLIQSTNHTTVLHAVPSLMRQWLDFLPNASEHNIYPDLRLLLVGGEPIPERLLRDVKGRFPEVKLLGLYGMTELAVVCSSFEFHKNLPEQGYYRIGRPHKNCHFFVLDRFGLKQPTGVPGELCISGPSVALEYINQPELTKERFTENLGHYGDRLYRTGDRVRQLSDGSYAFLGRLDYQINLHGVRIEPGEIEALAMDIQGVKQAIAVVMRYESGNEVLVLYYVPLQAESNAEKLTDSIRTKLTANLPDYMRPTVIQHLDQLPLNANGKVDRRALIVPETALASVEPNGAIELKLLEIWAEIFQIDAIGVTDNFFERGGNSISLIRLASKVEASFTVSLPLSSFFENPTIRTCAILLESHIRSEYLEILTHDNHDGLTDQFDELIL
jgi:amino acid adenylation domain-containing protein